ncbi:Dickkopf_N domain-containing protein [Durusdinium trenchii]|uniref:Dickkopf_N domain-containing protein n=1 Tax=Durusdinium trenchii TaxID=1381693 RepID=A0ABP0S6N6_9DINO
MIHHETREMLFTLFKKPRETVEVIVDSLMPAAMVYNYTWQEVKHLLRPCFQEMGSNGGKLHFAHLQKIVLQNQRARLQALLKDKNSAYKESQSLQVAQLTETFARNVDRKILFSPSRNMLFLSPDIATVYWRDTSTGATVTEKATEIIQRTEPAAAYFPMSFANFRKSADGFRIQGVLIENITQPEALFLQLDKDIDGMLSAAEFGRIGEVFQALSNAVSEMRTAQVAARRLQESVPKQQVTPEVCNARNPRQYYCSFDADCKEDCKACGWKSATDRAFSICVQPSPEVCYADGGQVFCPSDEQCHPPGDCQNCVDRTVVDHAQHICLALWWDPAPLTEWTNWVCRWRNKVGMPCTFDQDCIYGMRRCLSGACMPFQPYNANQTCESDYDCPHLGFYCPSDPTGGQNPYWVQYCRAQRSEGMTCAEDRECEPGLRCNVGEPQPRCRKLFSLKIGALAAEDVFCEFGWRDRDGKCAPPAQSKQAGRSCDTDLDCETTDETGRTGSCTCKAWWDKDDPKYCKPVSGDFAKHQEALRDYLWFRASRCGTFWTEAECLRIFGNEATTGQPGAFDQ